ncbi:MAG: hypothetical protein ACI4KF_02085 [Huintestinicola sp.]
MINKLNSAFGCVCALLASVCMSCDASAASSDVIAGESGDVGIVAYAVPAAIGAITFALKKRINK